MRRIVLFLLVSLCQISLSFSQTILNTTDSTVIITQTQLKQVNQIFLEHQKLLKTDSIQKNQIKEYKQIVSNLETVDSLRREELYSCSQAAEAMYKDHKNLKTKNKVLTGTTVVALLLLIFL